MDWLRSVSRSFRLAIASERCSAIVVTKRYRGSRRPALVAERHVQEAEQLALREHRHAHGGRIDRLADVLAHEAVLSPIDQVRPAPSQGPALVHGEEAGAGRRTPGRHGLDQSGGGRNDADTARLVRKELARHRRDDVVGLLEAATGAQHVAHLTEQADSAFALFELGHPLRETAVGFLQRRLGLLALGDVLEHDDAEPRHRAGLVHHRGGQVDPDRLAVAAQDAPFGPTVIDRPFDQVAPVALGRLGFIGVKQIAHQPPAQLVGREAEHVLHRPVRFDDAAAGFAAGDPDQRRLEYGPETLFALGQRPLGLPAIGDIAKVEDDRADARFAQPVHPDGLEMAELAVLMAAPVARADGHPRLPEHIGEEPCGVVAVVGMEAIEEMLADE